MLLDGGAPLPGQIMQYPNLARTFQIVAKEGKDGFYRRRIAEAIVEVIQSGGGVMDKEDLAMHQSALIETIRYTYGGEVTIHEVNIALMLNKGSCINETPSRAHRTAKAGSCHIPNAQLTRYLRHNRPACSWDFRGSTNTEYRQASIRDGP